MNVGIISDTHGKYREEWKDVFKRCDYLLHAGDVDTQEAYDWFMDLGLPVYLVQGNCDKGMWAHYLPETMNVPIGGKLFCLIHNRAYLPMQLDDIDFVVFGHTHFPTDEMREGIRFINPGTAGRNRGAGTSMMILHMDGEQCELEKIPLR